MSNHTGRTRVEMRERKRLALIAHDNCKGDLLDWARFNRGTLAAHDLYATARPARLSRRSLTCGSCDS
jgi:methylglyoxal synthase